MSNRKKSELLQLAQRLGNISEACRMIGYSRESYYRFKKLYETGGTSALKNQSRRRPLPSNRVSEEVENAVLALAAAHPRWGQSRVSNELRKRGYLVSPTGVRGVWLRHDLHTMEKRAQSLEGRVLQEGLILSPSQKWFLRKLRVSDQV